MRIGVMEGVLRQPRERVFAVARDLGFQGLEIEVRGDREALAAASAEAGLPVCSLICDGSGLGAADAGERAAARERLAAAVEDAARLGAGGLLLPRFRLLAGKDAEAAETRFAADLRACASGAEARGVAVAWENDVDAETTRRILEAVRSPAARCYFDLANAAKRGADPAAELRLLGDLVYQVHAKNVNKQPLDAPGVDLRACLAALRERGYGGWIVLETPPGDDPAESARHNREVLRAAWGEAREGAE